MFYPNHGGVYYSCRPSCPLLCFFNDPTQRFNFILKRVDHYLFLDKYGAIFLPDLKAVSHRTGPSQKPPWETDWTEPGCVTHLLKQEESMSLYLGQIQNPSSPKWCTIISIDFSIYLALVRHGKWFGSAPNGRGTSLHGMKRDFYKHKKPM